MIGYYGHSFLRGCFGYGYFPFFHIGIALIGSVILVLTIVLIVKAFKKNKPNNNYSEYNRISEILDMKYASGEIDEEEYLKRKKNIGIK